MDHYFRAYWKLVWVRSWRDAWDFMRSHVAWEFCLVLGGIVVTAIWQYCRSGGLDFWHELLFGLALTGSAALLVWLAHFLAVTPARMHKDSLATVASVEKQRDGLKEDFDNRPHLSVEVMTQPRPHGHNAAVLVIENLGGRAERVSAELSFVPGEPAPLIHDTRFLSGIYEIPISKGGKLSATIASVVATSANSATWKFNLRDHEKDKLESVDLQAGSYPSRRDSVTIKVRITCHPDNQIGPIEWQVTFQEKNCTAEQLMPSLAPPQEGPPATTA